MYDFIKKHFFGVAMALVVGLICVAPHYFLVRSLGSEYRGFPMMRTDNETEYLARLQEIDDSHYRLGSIPFFEYKDQSPLLPPNIFEFGLVTAHRLTHYSLVSVLIASKFLFPVMLFLLIYLLVYQLSGDTSRAAGFNAIATGVFVTLGYDLLNKATLLSLLGKTHPGAFIIWTRPSNPVTGGILLFGLLLVLWSLFQKEKLSIGKIILGGLLLAAMITSYFFSWGLALTVCVMSGLWALGSHRFILLKNIIAIVSLGFVLASPYLYLVYRAHQSPWYPEAARRMLLFYSHVPLLNTLVIVALVCFFLLTVFEDREPWWYFCLVILLASLGVFAQQVLTGIAIWPFHFVQYTKPLSYMVIMVVAYRVLRPIFPRLWTLAILGILLISLTFGIYTQASTYAHSYQQVHDQQRLMDVFDWFNNHAARDCVILVREGLGVDQMTRLLPAFTHCNTYATDNNLFLIPFERIYQDYLVTLRINGLEPSDIGQYLVEHPTEVTEYFYGTQTDSHIGDEYRRYQADQNISAKLLVDYPVFVGHDFLAELRRYRIDYLLSQGPIDPAITQSLHNPKLLAQIGDYFVYDLR